MQQTIYDTTYLSEASDCEDGHLHGGIPQF